MPSYPKRAVRRYPRWCYEEKRYPDGGRNRFRSRVLLLRPGHGVLHFVSDRAYDLGGIYLPRRTVTFGPFWEDPPTTCTPGWRQICPRHAPSSPSLTCDNVSI